MNNLATRLKYAREMTGMSQQDLANRAGIPQSTIGNLESGLRQSSASIPSLASILGVEALWLADGMGPSGPDMRVLEQTEDAIAQISELVLNFQQASEEGRREILSYAKSAPKRIQ